MPATDFDTDFATDFDTDFDTDFATDFDIVFLSLEPWDEIWRRNQFLCAGWSRRHPNRKILFVTPPRVLPLALKNRDFSALQKLKCAPNFENIHVFQPLRLLPNSLLVLRACNDWHERRQIRAVMRRLHLARPLLWLNSHFGRHLVGKTGEIALIYDITDDWTALTQTAARRRLVTRLDAELCRLADCVIVCSALLETLKTPLTKNLKLVPNGVDLAHYDRVRDAAWPAHPLTQGWQRPVLGYTGTLHPDRVDIDLIIALAKAFPDATVALVGPNMLPAEARTQLEKVPNIKMTGALPYSQIPAVMRAFSVCLAPHLETEFTQSLNPIKLWEFLAAGLPIVATDVAGFRDFAPLVKIASGAENFIAACKKALEGDDLAAQRQEIAAQNSWDARLNAIEAILAATISNRVTR